MDLAVSWNKELAMQAHQTITLNKQDTLPHVSLLMGCLPSEWLPDAERILRELADQQRCFPLFVLGLRTLAGSHPVVSLDIELSEPLKALQRRLIHALEPLLTRDAQDNDLYEAQAVSPAVLTWINSFVPDQCEDRFWPHITLGHGHPRGIQPPFTFTASRIAICHLGDHCTCRHILAEASLPL